LVVQGKYTKRTDDSKQNPETEASERNPSHLPSPDKEDAMSNTRPAKSRSKRNKNRKFNQSLSRYKAPIWVCPPITHDLDDEGLSVMAGLEWISLDEDTKNVITGLGIFDQEEFIDVRVGMKHKSVEDLISWASEVGVGHVRDQGDLEKYFDGQILALSMVAQWEKYHTGVDIIDRAKVATRNLKISNTIRSHDLPSGAKYFYAPYIIGSNEHVVWLLKYSRRFERP
jgi:hypothetical protein